MIVASTACLSNNTLHIFSQQQYLLYSFSGIQQIADTGLKYSSNIIFGLKDLANRHWSQIFFKKIEDTGLMAVKCDD